MTDIDKAREWAESVGNIEGLMPGTRATVEVIQSLPDQWVDAEKLERIIAGMNCCLTQGSETNFSDGFKEATTTWRDALEALIAPKLPTLADMTQEERKACQWMQAKTWYEVGILVWVDEDTEIAQLITRVNGVLERKFKDVTPLPDLPRLEWPGGAVGAEIVEAPETVDAPPAEKAALPKPEDVPPNEPWLIEANGQKAIGTRYAGSTVVPWSVAALDGSFAGDYNDNEITLIHKLVPESPALPEGMRLADHEEYGRVVVSPKVDTDGDHKAFLSDPGEIAGATWKYAHKSKLTFLDGDQRA